MTGATNQNTNAHDLDCPIAERTIAVRWGKSIRTLQRWRAEGYGPIYLRIGGTIHYRLRDVLAFEVSASRGGEVAK